MLSEKVLVKIFRVVILKIEALCGVTLRFFRDADHEDFATEVLNFLGLLA